MSNVGHNGSPRLLHAFHLAPWTTEDTAMNGKPSIIYIVVAIAIAVQLGVAIYALATGADLAGTNVPVQVNRTLLF